MNALRIGSTFLGTIVVVFHRNNTGRCPAAAEDDAPTLEQRTYASPCRDRSFSIVLTE